MTWHDWLGFDSDSVEWRDYVDTGFDALMDFLLPYDLFMVFFGPL